MKIKFLVIAVFAFIALQAANAMNIISKGDGVVFIHDAITPSGVRPEIFLIELDKEEKEREIPVADTKEIEIEYRGNDIVVTDLASDRQNRQLLVRRIDNGNEQTLRMSLSGGGNTSSVIQSSGGGNSVSIPQNGGAKMSDADIIPPIQKFVPDQLIPTLRGPLLNKRFHNRDFSGQVLSSTKLINSRFKNVILEYADFSQSEVTNTTFVRCNLRKVNFINSKLVNTRFYKTDLTAANFTGAKLNNVLFNDSDLSGATWVNGEKCELGSIGQCYYYSP